MNFFVCLRATLWTVLFLACFSEIDSVGLSCYQCTIAPNPGARHSSSQICSHFNKTAHFQTYCPNSSLCMKKSIRYRVGNGSLVVTSVERGCAPQLNVTQVWDDNKRSWYTKQEVVTSAYDERCFIGEDRGSPGGPPEYCFCSFNLCNGSDTTKMIHSFAFVSTILVLWIKNILL